MACSCNPSLREAETGGELGLSAQPVYMDTERDAGCAMVTFPDFLQMYDLQGGSQEVRTISLLAR